MWVTNQSKLYKPSPQFIRYHWPWNNVVASKNIVAYSLTKYTHIQSAKKPWTNNSLTHTQNGSSIWTHHFQLHVSPTAFSFSSKTDLSYYTYKMTGWDMKFSWQCAADCNLLKYDPNNYMEAYPRWHVFMPCLMNPTHVILSSDKQRI